LDKASEEITTFTTPWGNYYYKEFPLGLVKAPDIFLLEEHEPHEIAISKMVYWWYYVNE
jgi:hypothetical protein